MKSGRLLAGSLLDEQIRIEEDAVAEGVQRYRSLAKDATERGDGASLKPAERMLLHWFGIFSAAISHEKRRITKGRAGAGRPHVYGPYLGLLPTGKLAYIAMHQALGACLAHTGSAGTKTVALACDIGRAINAEVALAKVKKDQEAWKALTRTDRRRLKPKHINRVANKLDPGARWSVSVHAHLGGALLKMLADVASCDSYQGQFVPAFEFFKERKGKKTVGRIRLTDATVRLIDDGHTLRQHLYPRYRPMIVPPLPWTEFGRGGYMRLKCTLIKKPCKAQATLCEAPGGDLTRVFAGVNALGATAWRVNNRVLDVVKELWRSGGNIAGVPAADNAPLPPRPAAADHDPDANRDWRKAASAVHRANELLVSVRKNFLFTLAAAERNADTKEIWFPHQLDFRGRVYPIPLYLTPQGDDLCRGLLEFAEGKRLGGSGGRGWYWLRVHVANCCKIDRVPFDQRVEWTDANADVIRGWAADPLENTGWMLQKKPWQVLAAAFAFAAGPGAVSHLPIQMDGSCNGLQHYAALGRDPIGAAAVNLEPGGSPADVYTEVAELVAATVAADADNGVLMARLLDGKVDRDIVKQPVMTSVYGVTAVGARDQVYARLKEIGVGKDDLYPASKYLANEVLSAMGNVCVAATQLMRWLTDCARLIAAAGGSVTWTTPLGLPIVQPYSKLGSRTVSTVLGWLRLPGNEDGAPTAPRKQVNGFAPNFIHSIDACHLLMTASAMRDAGLAMGAVHDSYWTHACDIDEMNRILRREFIRLHAQPLIENLYESFRGRWPDVEFPAPPAPGGFDLNRVAESTYFFA